MRECVTISFLATVLISTLGMAATDASNPSVASYDLDVTFSPDQRSLSGTATIRFEDTATAPRQIVFSLHGELEVESVSVGESPAKFDQQKILYDREYSLVANRVTVETDGADLSRGLTVTYSGPFNRSRARSVSDYMRIDADGVLLRAYYYSLWFPVFLGEQEDSRPVDFNRVVLRTPQEFTTVFTGTHEGDRIEDGTRISTWTSPATDLSAAQCTSRRFDVTVAGRLTLYAEQNETSRAAASEIARVAAGLDRIYRRDYRKDAVSGQMHIMQMPRFGEISSGNVVGMTSEDWNGFAESFIRKLTLAHELVHPFVQLKTDRDDPLYAMGIEGFPAFMHLPALAELDGGDGYAKMMAWYEKMYLRRRETGKDWRGRPLPVEKPIVDIGADEIGDYKDSLVLGDRAILFQNWLRTTMGVDRFREFTRELFSSTTGSYARFRALLQSFLPDAQDDIDLWLGTTAYPERLRLPATAE